MLEEVWEALKRLFLKFFSRETGLAELASGIGTFFWGLILVTTPPMATWRSLDLLLKYWDSEAWGWLSVTLGAGQLVLMPKVEDRWEIFCLRLATAVLLSWLWLMNLASALWPGLKEAIGDNGAAVPPWTAAIFMGAFINFYLIVRIVLGRR